MIYEEKITVPAREKVVIHVSSATLAPCLRCAGDEVEIREYEDQFGFISTARCRRCGWRVKVNANTATAINAWNNETDIDLLIQRKQAELARLKNDIAALKVTQRQRKKTRNKKTP